MIYCSIAYLYTLKHDFKIYCIPIKHFIEIIIMTKLSKGLTRSKLINPKNTFRPNYHKVNMISKKFLHNASMSSYVSW